jgi:hypothetical protein
LNSTCPYKINHWKHQMTLQRYRAVQRKVRGKTEMERDAELVRFIKAGHNTNLLAYASLRESRVNQQLTERILNGCHFRRGCCI